MLTGSTSHHRKVWEANSVHLKHSKGMRSQGQCTRMEGPQLTEASNPLLGILSSQASIFGDFSTIPGPTGPNITFFDYWTIQTIGHQFCTTCARPQPRYPNKTANETKPSCMAGHPTTSQFFGDPTNPSHPNPSQPTQPPSPGRPETDRPRTGSRSSPGRSVARIPRPWPWWPRGSGACGRPRSPWKPRRRRRCFRSRWRQCWVGWGAYLNHGNHGKIGLIFPWKPWEKPGWSMRKLGVWKDHPRIGIQQGKHQIFIDIYYWTTNMGDKTTRTWIFSPAKDVDSIGHLFAKKWCLDLDIYLL